ncbi:hypothetical protein HRI_000214700 [Hibiscus trionum]|uniref:Reverse transcriptase domain-containing protein n=1 Tax=Hibiscus trionum TaxID=183268 RepID=A0A9W7GTQ0_HIBTR|nr:hypothetical protein HRI_000214700 [Hibiscus trionum]
MDRPFTVEEIWETIRASDGNKAPGPDGMNLDFYKKIWPHIKDKVLRFCEDFYKGKINDKFYNHSFLAMIPKKESPKMVEDYRPISLVNSLYKIVAKILSKRLSSCISEVVGENQFAFIPGKQISDCALIANEIIDDLRKRRKTSIVFKADFRRAYNTVDWSFLDLIMQKMGFSVRWRKWISECLSLALVSVLVNGKPSKAFSIKRGLRQGCPLSPLLFNLVGEALSLLLKKADAMGFIEGVQIGSSDVSISHLQFADGLVVFAKGDRENVINIKRLLRVFGLASGLSLNLSKTNLFGIAVDQLTVEEWAVNLGFKAGLLPSTYLGLPLGASRNSVQIWNPIIDKVKGKLAGWKGNFLSIAGRVCLIKSVLNNLLIYFPSLFKMPVSIADTLNRLFSHFLWGPHASRPIHWVKWDKVVKPKQMGGLGIADIQLKNRALINKWAWRYSFESGCLWRRIVDAKYNYDSNSLIPLSVDDRKSSWM